MEDEIRTKHNSELVYNVLCCIFGNEEVVSFIRTYNDMCISETFSICKEVLTAKSAEDTINILSPGEPDDSSEDEPQGLKHLTAAYRLIHRIFNVPIPEEKAHLLENLPGIMKNFPEFISKNFHPVHEMINTLPQGRVLFNEILNSYEKECLGKYREMKRLVDSAPDIYLRNYETILSKLKDSLKSINSGSRAEGFDFQSSDYDIMISTTMVKVIQNTAHGNHSDTSFVLLMEKENTRPGFVRLRATRDPWMMNYLFIKYDQGMYLSHRLLKQFTLRLTGPLKSVFKLHGPCLAPENDIFDIAPTLFSDTWSHDAFGCVHRMLKCRWPSVDDIRGMVNDGIFFVPIGCSQSPHEEVEWRMSFSLAEKRLVHAMNHTQFLVYGLLKLFLKEVVEQNSECKGLLCSYFMKTSVFWEIMETKIAWNPCCLLHHFWNCLRRILSWINNEYCPNFFIPENNMFYGKINGRNRQKLLRYLGSLHREGYNILEKIPTFKHEFDKWMAVPRQSVNHGLDRSKVILKLITCPSFSLNASSSTEVQNAFASSKSGIISEYFQFLRLLEINTYCNRKLCEQTRENCCNRIRYMKEKALIRVLRASSPDCIRSTIFLALYLYSGKRYDKSVNLLYKVLHKLDDIETVCTWAFEIDKFSALGGDFLSVVESMRRLSVSQIPFDAETCIPEIYEEFNIPFDGIDCRVVLPFVLTHFLLCLCHFRQSDLTQAKLHLTELEFYNRHCLMKFRFEKDYRLGASLMIESMSWEILGIGHEIVGDFPNALKSFTECQKIFLSYPEVCVKNKTLFKANKERIMRMEAILKRD